MKPVFQYRLDNGNWSNCFSACVASLLELNADAVPDWMWKDGALNDDWYSDFSSWLASYGFRPMMILNQYTDPHPLLVPDVYYIVGGMGSHGIMHASIGLNGKIVHDPYPNREPISEIHDFTFFVRSFL